MKRFSHFVKKIVCLCLLLTIGSCITVIAQDTHKEKHASKVALIKNLVESQHYVFVAQMVLPMNGNTRQLTSEYDVKVSKDTISSYLPYFGRAYSASLNPDDAGIKFVSKDFKYKTTSHKKGVWDIQISPVDTKNVQQLNFFISEDGYASLQVILTDRQSISFNGYVKAGKEKK